MKGADDGIEAGGDEGTHVQDGSHLRATAPDRPPAAMPLSDPVQMGDADESRDLLLAEGAELGDERQHCAGKDLADAGDTLEEVVLLAPDGRAFDSVVQVAVDLFKLLLEPLDGFADRSPDALR